MTDPTLTLMLGLRPDHPGRGGLQERAAELKTRRSRNGTGKGGPAPRPLGALFPVM